MSVSHPPHHTTHHARTPVSCVLASYVHAHNAVVLRVGTRHHHNNNTTQKFYIISWSSYQPLVSELQWPFSDSSLCWCVPAVPVYCIMSLYGCEMLTWMSGVSPDICPYIPATTSHLQISQLTQKYFGQNRKLQRKLKFLLVFPISRYLPRSSLP